MFTYKQSTITHQKVTAMHPMNEEGVDDMASLTELHGGSIMYNLFQRYKRKQIYVSSACSSSGEEVCVAQCAGPTFTSSVIHPQHATPHTQRPLRLECSGFFSPTSKEYVLPFECLSLISENLCFVKFCQVRNLREKSRFSSTSC